MALIKCPECGCEVSEFAEMCPKCAYPVREYLGSQRNTQNEPYLSKPIDNKEQNLQPENIIEKTECLHTYEQNKDDPLAWFRKFMGIYILGGLSITSVLVLCIWFPPWLAALIVTGVLAFIGISISLIWQTKAKKIKLEAEFNLAEKKVLETPITNVDTVSDSKQKSSATDFNINLSISPQPMSISPQSNVLKPASITVFGILNIIFGIFGVIGGLLSCTVSQATAGLFGADKSWLFFRDSINFIGSLILISCGIGLCASAQWARSTAVWYGILMSIFSVISLIISLSTMSGLNNMMNNSFFGAGVSAGIMGGIIGGAISILYYLMMAGYLSRSAVTGYFIYKQNNT